MEEGIKTQTENLTEFTRYLEKLEQRIKEAEGIRIIAEDARCKAEEARKIAESIRAEIFNKLRISFEKL